MSNDTRPEIRFPGFADDWELRKLGDMLSERKIRSKISKEIPLLAFAAGQGVIDRSERKTNNRDFLTKDANTKMYLLTKYNDIVYNPSNLKYGAIDRNKYGLGVISPIYVTFETNQVPAFIELIVTSYSFKQRALQYEEGTVTKRQSVKPENLLALDVSISKTLDEQQKIGAFFKQLDNTITLHQRKLDLLKETKKGFLQKMFPKNGAKVPEIRFPGFTKDWEERKLGSIYDFSKGKGLPLNSFTYSKDDPAIAYGHLYTKYSEVISEVYLSSDDDGVLSKDNDLLFPGSSTVPNGTAQANAIMLNNVKLGGDIIIARPKQDTRVLSIFMSYQINSQRQKLFPITVGTTITHMYGKDLSKVKFFITNYSEQQKIGSFFKQLDDTIALHQHELDLLKETKKGFLQKMFV
ncbi:restriction endonuclease subunit S [Enterococcus sp. JM9B]|uniref:restriction endonuclease subunit S n=1 Tax=Enterococcus sp. JM9B TaxID=1857216 RepID=UPI001374A870|nr:restriction endonuclease subunit S [Enterococcus sp. JM9B]KAF1304328.1 hypothetical protein BAU16_02000 [Enterococcus sp. JM9B]